MTKAATYYMSVSGFLQLSAKLAPEVGDVDETDPGTAPEVIVHLCYRRDTRRSVFQCVLDFCRLRATALHAQQAHDGRQAVLDSVAHLTRQQGLVFKGVPKLGIRLLPLDGDAEQPGKTRQEIRIRKVELSGVRAVNFQDSERQVAFAASRDQDIDRALDAVIGEQPRRTKTRFLLKVIGDHDLRGVERIAGGRFHVDS